MQHVVLATAGHIDHGKTRLTLALTGIDTDRLPEEKARGITIDLGFAHAVIGGRQVAFIDVPGHERFVKNMLAGVGGVDLALLVVAADESVMPQTREHLAILKLLGVPHGVVALTKRDLADPETLELARLEVTDFVRGTFLEEAPVVPVSARTGEGMEELKQALASAVARVAGRDASGALRLHIDRAFSIKGFGAVVTGTVVSGVVRVGDEVEVSPLGKLVKVRGLEVHGEEAEEARAGSRAAINLAGVDLADLSRGEQVLTPGLFPAAMLLDVRLRLLGDAPALKDLARVRFHLGADEVLARVHLLASPERRLAPGGEALAQLRLERPIVAWPGDRFIIRSYSPMVTIGGGVVIESGGAKLKGAAVAAAEWLGALGEAAPAERLRQEVIAAGRRGTTLAELVARSGRLPEHVTADLATLTDLVPVTAAGPRFFARAAWGELADRVLAALKEFHAREPLREGMSREELRARVFAEDAVSARLLLDQLAAGGRVRLKGDLVAHAEHRVVFSDAEREVKDKIESAFSGAGLNPPAIKEVLDRLGPARARGEKLLPVLVREGRLIALPGGVYFHTEPIAGLKRKLVEHAGDGRALSVADFKELTGTSRKYAIPLLEHLDAIRFTRRQGDARVVIGSLPSA